MTQSGGKRRGLPPVQKGPTMMAPAPKVTIEEDNEPLSTFEEQALVIDPNLLVGPVYDNSKSRAKALKEQLGDINTRLQSTLTTFDTVNPFDHDEDMLSDLDAHVNGMEAGQIKATLKHFLNNYRDMSAHAQESSKEREDILYQLSDWFTLDHMEDLDIPVPKQDEEEASDSYSSALVNFEKFKRLQTQINTATTKGQKVDHLLMEKRKLEKSVMGGFKSMKKAKESQSPAGDTTWKHAADEVVGLLKKVRGESSGEIDVLKNKVDGLVSDLQKKSKSVDSLQKALKDQKMVVSKFADDNANLTDEVARLKFRIQKLEVDLENATKLLQNQIDMSAIQLPTVEDPVTGKEIKVTLSFIMKQLGEVTNANNLKRMPSDPAVLRTQLRENQETIEAFSRELIKLHEKIKGLEESCNRKDALLMDLEAVNSELRERMWGSGSRETLSTRQSSISMKGPKKGSSSHVCRCHLSSSVSIAKSSSQDLRPKDEKGDTDRLYKKLAYFRKALADAEMKLSQAYKEMADMRRQSIAMDFSGTDMRKGGSESDDEDKNFKFQDPDGKDKKKAAKEPKRAKKNIRRRSIKPKAKRDKSLPPINQPVIPEPEEPPMPEFDDERENTLWKIGDIQARLNLLISGIQSFVADIGSMIDKDGEEKGVKQPTMQQYTFGQSFEEKTAKNTMNQKISENRQRKGQAMLNGQRAVANLREAYNLLSASLSLGHDDYENIYRAYKKHQQIRAVHHAAMMGRLPGGTNLVRMRSNENTVEYYLKTSGGGGQAGPTVGATSYQSWEVMASRVDGPASETSSKASLHSNTGIPMDDALLYHNMKRSKSDLHLNVVRSGEVFMVGGQEPRSEVVSVNKEEVMLPRAKIPKKGLIKLTALDQELDNPEFYNGKKDSDGHKGERRKSETQKSLIKRKNIIQQIKEGNKMLEEEELKMLQMQAEEEEGEVHIEDYTLSQLQDVLTFGNIPPGEKAGDESEERKDVMENAGKTPKMPKLLTVSESIKQTTFQLPILKK